MAVLQTTPAASAEDLRQALRAEQLRLIFEYQPFNIVASLVVAAIVAMTLLSVTNALCILLWLAAMVIGNAIRAATVVGWRRDSERAQRALIWWRYLLIASLIGGAGWGLCNFLLFPTQNLQQQMLLVFITCGISAAAAVSLAADRRIAWSFLIPCVLPLELQLYLHSNGFGASLSVMGFVYLLFMAGVINRLYNYIKDDIALRLADTQRERTQNEYAHALQSSQEKLLALNKRLSLATQAGGIGVWEVDLVRDELVWDDRMYEIYGVERSSQPVTLAVPGGLMHPDDSTATWEAFRAALLDPTAVHFTSEFRIVRSDNTERAVRQNGNIWRDEAGRALGLVGVLWDVTDMRRVERMKSEFVSTVSHELRTPLTSIRGSLGLVASGVLGELPTAALELIDIAYKNSERLSRLINDILDIEKIESGKMHLDLQPQSLRTLMQQVVAANQGFAQSFSVPMTLRVDSDVIVVVDADRFMQVMANLISNAVKFSNTDDNVEIVVMAAPAHARIEVRDRGPGIAADFYERIFLRFSQADSSNTRARGGSGLGLAISKTLVEKMHGEIGFAARANGGTIFFVELPRGDLEIDKNVRAKSG